MTDPDLESMGPAALAFALQRTVRRRAALGARRVPFVEGPSARDPAPGDPAPGDPARADPAAGAPESSADPRSAHQGPKVSPIETYALPRDAPRPPKTAQPATNPTTDQPAVLAAACASLEALRDGVANCHACALAKTRTQTVFGDGLGTSRILFIGEAPGADEDRTGTPFVGRAGQLLTDIITKGMGLRRDEVAIANVLKCRPPENRDPLPEETTLCTGWLDRQIELIDPLVIVPLGRHATCHVLGVDAPLGRLRGRVHDHQGRKVVPTYHPAYLLRSPHEKKKTWEDIKLAMHEAGIPLPPGSR